VKVTLHLPRRYQHKAKAVVLGALEFLGGVSEALRVAGEARGEVDKLTRRLRKLKDDELSGRR
jgi:hypothetical protein